ALSLVPPEPTALSEVKVDGEPHGTLPQFMDHVAPGPHQLQFSGPGLDTWDRAIEVNVGEAKEVLATPMRAPATGVIHVRSGLDVDEDDGTAVGDPVFRDGERRGRPALTLEISRGPHSVRVEPGGAIAPVQVVDLPGGNERFLSFEFGSPPSLRFVHQPLSRISVIQPPLVSATLVGTPQPKVKEMWLNVRTPEGSYRRYAMTLLAAPGSTARTVAFP